MYKNEDKFGRIGDNFIFKQNIFYDKYWLISLPSNIFFKGTFIILISQTYTHFYTHYDSIIWFKDFCQKIRLFFKDVEWKRLNLIK